jgi:hypothetical protein
MQKNSKTAIQTRVTAPRIHPEMEAPTHSPRSQASLRIPHEVALGGAEEEPKTTKTQTTKERKIRNDQGCYPLHLKIKKTAKNMHVRIGNGILESIAYIHNAGGYVL